MRQAILLTAALCALCAQGFAQGFKPKYAYPDDTVHNDDGTVGWGGGDVGKWEAIYYPSNFAAMPSGSVRTVYFRVGGMLSGAVWKDLKIRMQPTELSQYPNASASAGKKADTFIIRNGSGSLIASYPTFTVPAGTSTQPWIKVPVNAGNFYYNKGQKFAVQVEVSSISTNAGIVCRSITHPAYRLLESPKDSIWGGASVTHPDFGFDLATTGVESLGGLSAVGLFPNPAAGGRFNVSFEALQAAGGVSISVSDAAGRQVYWRSYAGVGTAFFKEVDMHGAPAGVYFLTLVAGGERIVRSVAVE